MDDLEDEDEDKNLTDAHHAWTWGAVWRGGEGGDLTMWFVNIASIFSTKKIETHVRLYSPVGFESPVLYGLDLNRSSVDLCCCWGRERLSH